MLWQVPQFPTRELSESPHTSLKKRKQHSRRESRAQSPRLQFNKSGIATPQNGLKPLPRAPDPLSSARKATREVKEYEEELRKQNESLNVSQKSETPTSLPRTESDILTDMSSKKKPQKPRPKSFVAATRAIKKRVSTSDLARKRKSVKPGNARPHTKSVEEAIPPLPSTIPPMPPPPTQANTPEISQTARIPVLNAPARTEALSAVSKQKGLSTEPLHKKDRTSISMNHEVVEGRNKSPQSGWKGLFRGLTMRRQSIGSGDRKKTPSPPPRAESATSRGVTSPILRVSSSLLNETVMASDPALPSPPGLSKDFFNAKAQKPITALPNPLSRTTTTKDVDTSLSRRPSAASPALSSHPPKFDVPTSLPTSSATRTALQPLGDDIYDTKPFKPFAHSKSNSYGSSLGEPGPEVPTIDNIETVEAEKQVQVQPASLIARQSGHLSILNANSSQASLLTPHSGTHELGSSRHLPLDVASPDQQFVSAPQSLSSVQASPALDGPYIEVEQPLHSAELPADDSRPAELDLPYQRHSATTLELDASTVRLPTTPLTPNEPTTPLPEMRSDPLTLVTGSEQLESMSPTKRSDSLTLTTDPARLESVSPKERPDSAMISPSDFPLPGHAPFIPPKTHRMPTTNATTTTSKRSSSSSGGKRKSPPPAAAAAKKKRSPRTSALIDSIASTPPRSPIHARHTSSLSSHSSSARSSHVLAPPAEAPAPPAPGGRAMVNPDYAAAGAFDGEKPAAAAKRSKRASSSATSNGVSHSGWRKMFGGSPGKGGAGTLTQTSATGALVFGGDGDDDKENEAEAAKGGGVWFRGMGPDGLWIAGSQRV